MSVQLVAPEPTESTDDIQFNVDLGSLFSCGEIALPGPLAVPSIMDPTVFGSAIDIWSPLTPDVPYAPQTVLGRIASPKIVRSDIINSWIAWNNVTTDTPLGKDLADLGASTGYAPNWIQELYATPTAPLPILSAAASLKALIKDETKFAGELYRGTPLPLNRDWLDGGHIQNSF